MKRKRVLWIVGIVACGAAACGDEGAAGGEQGQPDMAQQRPDMEVDQPEMAAPARPAWQGSWAVTASYTVRCSDPFREDRTAQLEGSWTVQLSGPDSGLEAQIGPNHFMEGVGSATLLSLSGAFPLRGTQDKEDASPVRSESQVTLRLDTIASATRAEGRVSGSFKTRDFIYATCAVEEGTVVFER